MANSIALAKLYAPLLQEAWAKESLTSLFESGELASVAKSAMANEVSVPTLSLAGLKDYSKVNGYSDANISLTWQTKQLTKDRGIKFNLDAVDNLESMQIIAGNVLSKEQRDYVVPEIDAYRFSQIVTFADSSQKVEASLSTGSAVLSAFDTAMVALDEANVPADGRVLFVSNSIYALLKGAFANRFIQNKDTAIGRDVEYIDNVRIVRVPLARFKTGWAKDDTNGGYTQSGEAINFLLIHPSSVFAVVKHNPVRMFTPEENQEADAYQFTLRIYHDIFAVPCKGKGIYVHKEAAASA